MIGGPIGPGGVGPNSVVNKTNSRNGPRQGESFSNGGGNLGGSGGSEFHGDTGHDYNI